MTKSSLRPFVRTRSQPISKLHRTHVRTSVASLSSRAVGARVTPANGTERNERRSIKSTRSDASTTSTSTTTSHDSKSNPPTDTHITSHTSHITPEDEQTIDRFFVPSSLSPIIQYHNTLYIYIYYIDICLLVYVCVIFIYWSKYLVFTST